MSYYTTARKNSYPDENHTPSQNVANNASKDIPPTSGKVAVNETALSHNPHDTSRVFNTKSTLDVAFNGPATTDTDSFNYVQHDHNVEFGTGLDWEWVPDFMASHPAPDDYQDPSSSINLYALKDNLYTSSQPLYNTYTHQPDESGTHFNGDRKNIDSAPDQVEPVSDMYKYINSDGAPAGPDTTPIRPEVVVGNKKDVQIPPEPTFPPVSESDTFAPHASPESLASALPNGSPINSLFDDTEQQVNLDDEDEDVEGEEGEEGAEGGEDVEGGEGEEFAEGEEGAEGEEDDGEEGEGDAGGGENAEDDEDEGLYVPHTAPESSSHPQFDQTASNAEQGSQPTFSHSPQDVGNYQEKDFRQDVNVTAQGERGSIPFNQPPASQMMLADTIVFVPDGRGGIYQAKLGDLQFPQLSSLPQDNRNNDNPRPSQSHSTPNTTHVNSPNVPQGYDQVAQTRTPAPQRDVMTSAGPGYGNVSILNPGGPTNVHGRLRPREAHPTSQSTAPSQRHLRVPAAPSTQKQNPSQVFPASTTTGGPNFSQSYSQASVSGVKVNAHDHLAARNVMVQSQRSQSVVNAPSFDRGNEPYPVSPSIGMAQTGTPVPQRVMMTSAGPGYGNGFVPNRGGPTNVHGRLRKAHPTPQSTAPPQRRPRDTAAPLTKKQNPPQVSRASTTTGGPTVAQVSVSGARVSSHDYLAARDMMARSQRSQSIVNATSFDGGNKSDSVPPSIQRPANALNPGNRNIVHSSQQPPMFSIPNSTIRNNVRTTMGSASNSQGVLYYNNGPDFSRPQNLNQLQNQSAMPEIPQGRNSRQIIPPFQPSGSHITPTIIQSQHAVPRQPMVPLPKPSVSQPIPAHPSTQNDNASSMRKILPAPKRPRGRPIGGVNTPVAVSPTLPTSNYVFPILADLPPTDPRRPPPFLNCRNGFFQCQYGGAATSPFGCRMSGIEGTHELDLHMSVHAQAEEHMLRLGNLSPEKVWALLWIGKTTFRCSQPGCDFVAQAWLNDDVMDQHEKDAHNDIHKAKEKLKKQAEAEARQ